MRPFKQLLFIKFLGVACGSFNRCGLLAVLASLSPYAAAGIFSALSTSSANLPPAPALALDRACLEQMKSIPGGMDEAELKAVCAKVTKLDGCDSVSGAPIYHFEREGSAARPKRILAKALIHGDERLAGTVGRAWMLRLNRIEPRNSWRVIPVANPDGFKAGTRTNAHGVDINRNFPTKNWKEQALNYWKKSMKSDPRRNPGSTAASEPETNCLIKQFSDFKPDFIISIHTPLGVLDLDGPKVKQPLFRPLPWMSLGNFPGSLGRYMWVDRKVPVLTIELKGNEAADRLEAFDQLQDISGTIAIQASMDKKLKEMKDGLESIQDIGEAKAIKEK